MRDTRAKGDQIAAIAVSGYGQAQDIQRSKAAGFAAHLVKPVRPRSELVHRGADQECAHWPTVLRRVFESRHTRHGSRGLRTSGVFAPR